MSAASVSTQPGRHQLPQEFVDRHKRERVVAAIAELAHERGAGELPSLREELVGVAVRPFLGDEAAASYGKRLAAAQLSR
jgi:hypothetical protein